MARIWSICTRFCGARRPAVLKARKAEPIPLSALKAFVAPRPPHTEMSTAKLTAITRIVPRRWQEAVGEYLSKQLRVER